MGAPRTPALAGLVALAGLACASLLPPPDGYLEPWMGRPSDAVLQVWGPPSRVYPTYEWQLAVYRGWEETPWQRVAPGMPLCEITFLFYRGRVSYVSWTGEGWYCASIARRRPAP